MKVFKAENFWRAVGFLTVFFVLLFVCRFPVEAARLSPVGVAITVPDNTLPQDPELPQPTFPKKYLVVSPLSQGGPQVAIYNHQGKLVMSFLAYDRTMRSGLETRAVNVDGREGEEIITVPRAGAEPEFRVFTAQGKLLHKFTAYRNFRRGVNWDVFDVNGDGFMEIITAPGPGGSSDIKVFSYKGNVLERFMGFGPKYDKGTLVAATNFEQDNSSNDGKGEIVVAPMQKSGQVRVFNYKGILLNQFHAYGEDYNGGIASLVLAKLDKEISDFNYVYVITGQASQGNSVRTFYSNSGGRNESIFSPYDRFKGGVEILIDDVDNDHQNDIVTIPHATAAPHVKVFHKNGGMKSEFRAYPDKTITKGELSMTTGDFTGDGKNDLAFGTGPGLTSQVRIMDYKGNLIAEFRALGQGFKGGLYLSSISADSVK